LGQKLSTIAENSSALTGFSRIPAASEIILSRSAGTEWPVMNTTGRFGHLLRTSSKTARLPPVRIDATQNHAEIAALQKSYPHLAAGHCDHLPHALFDLGLVIDDRYPSRRLPQSSPRSRGNRESYLEGKPWF
jgi:hypothetical protein